ncbi:unnamed protein product, partial [Ectocarpus sp. 8 AP-2014]
MEEEVMMLYGATLFPIGVSHRLLVSASGYKVKEYAMVYCCSLCFARPQPWRMSMYSRGACGSRCGWYGVEEEEIEIANRLVKRPQSGWAIVMVFGGRHVIVVDHSYLAPSDAK